MTTDTNFEKQAETPASAERTRSGQFYRPNVAIIEQGNELGSAEK